MKMKWTEKLFTFAAVGLLAILIGCVAVQKAVSPAWIEKPSYDYVVDSNGILPFQIPRFWWTSVADAELMDKLLTFKHKERQLMLERAKEDDSSWYALLKGQSQEHLQNAYALQTELFTPQGAIGAILLSGLSMYVGAIGFSKPADKRELAKLNNKGAEKPTVT